jgi:hypothetical protein
VGKFHVGDRWADEDGCEWFVYRVSTENVYAVDSGGVTVVFTYGRSMSGLVLTRLISSERWIPFAEMMPEAPETVGKRRLVVCDHHGEMMFLVPMLREPAATNTWRCLEFPFGITFTANCGWTWKYLQPPEAS